MQKIFLLFEVFPEQNDITLNFVQPFSTLEKLEEHIHGIVDSGYQYYGGEESLQFARVQEFRAYESIVDCDSNRQMPNTWVCSYNKFTGARLDYRNPRRRYDTEVVTR